LLEQDGFKRIVFPEALVPAKAGIQLQLERFVGFTWVPAFAGTSGLEDQPELDAL